MNYHEKPKYAFVKVAGRFVRIDRDPAGTMLRWWRHFGPAVLVVAALSALSVGGIALLMWLTRGLGT